jgi:hypothetical protein
MIIKPNMPLGSWTTSATYMYSNNSFQLTIPFIHQFPRVYFTKAQYIPERNHIEIVGYLPKRDVNKVIFDNIPNNEIYLK